MAEHVIEVTDANFDGEIINSDVPAVVDFWAEWCGPCKALAPAVAELAASYDGRIKVGKMNVDHNQQTAVKYRIQAIPTLIAYKNGEVVAQVRGPRKADLKGFFEGLL